MMARVKIRPAHDSDLTALRGIEREIVTEFVWRMEWASPPAIGAIFSRFPLPRPLKLPYPRPFSPSCAEKALFLVAEHNGTPLGYICGDVLPSLGLLCLSDLAVAMQWRRKGVGSGLVRAAIGWAEAEGLRRVVLEMSFRNAPAVEFARRLGFAFSGFQYDYYPNGDAALFMAFNVAEGGGL